ncbi:hypothetical protein [Herbidospora sp. RD11066]
MKPILLSSCARAATAAEARFRIDAPLVPARATRVVALDPAAAEVVRRASDFPWHTARFYTGAAPAPGEVADVVLRSVEGVDTWLSDELTGVDSVVMVATANDGAAVASAIGDACTVSGIMTAGLVLAEGHDTRLAVAALRPHARVLLVTEDDDDVVEILTALRA